MLVPLPAKGSRRSPMIDRRNSRGAWSRGASFPVVSKAGFCALVGSPRIEFRVDDDRGGGWVMDRAMV